MTLSRWLRDYLYIPLGGNKGSAGAVARNIMITMILGGLWHGAGWTFVFWGAITGWGRWWAMCAGHAGGRGSSTRCPTSRLRMVVQRVATFHLVCLGWMFFNADCMSDAFTLIGRLFTAWGRSPWSPLWW